MASRSFEQSRLSVPEARDWVLGHVSDLPPDLAEITALLASELVTNAVLYGSGHFQVSVERFVDRRRVRIGVTDAGAGHPTPQNPDDTAEHGRGLQLVNALAASWGVQRQTHTKTVWFELPTQRSPGEPSERSHAEPRDRSYDGPPDRPTAEPRDRSRGQPPDRPAGEPRGRSYDRPPDRPPGEPRAASRGQPPDAVHPPDPVAIAPVEAPEQRAATGARSRWGRLYGRLVRRLWSSDTR